MVVVFHQQPGVDYFQPTEAAICLALGYQLILVDGLFKLSLNLAGSKIVNGSELCGLTDAY